jgi:hypothetical protein
LFIPLPSTKFFRKFGQCVFGKLNSVSKNNYPLLLVSTLHHFFTITQPKSPGVKA